MPLYASLILRDYIGPYKPAQAHYILGIYWIPFAGLKLSVYLSEITRHLERLSGARQRIIVGKISDLGGKLFKRY